MDAAHLRSPRYVAILAVVASLILVVGWLLRPRDVPQSPPPGPSETELEQLARRAERRSVESMSDYFARIARDVDPALVYIPAADTTGIVWDESRIVTGPLPPTVQHDEIAVEDGGVADIAATRRISGANLPLAALGVPVPAAATRMNVARRADTLPEAGGSIVAVWQTADAPAFAATNFRQAASTTCGLAPVREIVVNLSLSRAMVGGGLFDLDGDLLAVILPCDDHIAAIDTAGVDQLLTRADTLEQRLVARYGVRFDRMSEDERPYFRDGNGVLVREVWIDSPADAAGLWPGDVITSANGQAVSDIDDLRPVGVVPDMPLQLRVLRGARTLTVTLAAASPAAAAVEERDVGLIVESSPATYRIDAVVPNSRAARAGLQAGDRLVRIDRTAPRSVAQVRRILRARGGAPVLLEIARGARRIAILLP